MNTEATQSTEGHDCLGYLEPAIRSLVRVLRPESIILFGSHARRTQSRKSDLDLFIIQETDLRPLDRIAAASRHLPEMPCGVDVIVYTPGELEERRESPFIRRLLREGVVLYSRDDEE